MSSMQGSLYPDGILVDRAQLRRTELTKAAEILRNRTDWTSRGVYSGFQVTVNAVDTTRVDVAQGSGFTPDGSYIETTSAYYSILLDDYTLNAINYVCAVYTESSTHNQTHETDGQTYPTFSEMAYRIRVYEESNYLTVLAATDANLANDARDRMIVLAKVTANGAGNPLTSSSIESPTVYSNVLYANPSDLVTITGVTITAVSPGTGTGTTGSLGMTYVGGPPTYTFTWTSPTGGAGAPVAVTADGYYNFTDGLGEYITCLVVVSQLPTVVSAETIEIINLYYQAIPRLTGEDTLHRNFIGSGVVSPTNAHGQSLDDFGSTSLALLEEHQDVQHCNGIWRSSLASSLVCTVSNQAIADTLTVAAPALSDLYYVNGNKLNVITNAAGAPTTGIPFTPWQAAWGTQTLSGLFEIYLTDDGVLLANRKATYPVARTCTGTWIVDTSTSYPAGDYTLTIDTSGAYTTFQWDGGVIVSIATADFGVETGRAIRLFDYENVNWIDLWVNVDAFKVAIPDDSIVTVGGPFTDIITIAASPDWDANMQISSVCYWYDAGVPKGWLGYAPYDIARRVIDHRVYGNLCEAEISDNALQNLIYHPQDELHYSGVLLRRNNEFGEFDAGTPAGLVVDIAGGNYYCRGQRLEAAGDAVTLVDNVTNLVWLDMDGSYNVIDVTTDYGGNMQDAMQYVLGSSIYVPGIDDDTHSTDLDDPPERGVLLWMFETAGAAVTGTEDMRRNVNGAVDPWSVASRDVLTVGHSGYTLAAFGSLYAVFQYADLATTDRPFDSFTIDITITGLLGVTRKVTQPRNTTVTGTAAAIVILAYTGALPNDGIWALSAGNRVNGVAILASTNCTAFLLNDNVVIENCFFDYTGALTDTSFISLWNTGWAITEMSNVRISNNISRSVKAFLANPHNIANYYYDFKFLDNDITVTTGGTGGSGITMYKAYNLEISGNKFVMEDVLIIGAVYGILLDGCNNASIKNNVLEIGDSFGSAEYGIRLNDAVSGTCYLCTIENNFISRLSGSISTSGIGIYIDNCSYTNICNNSISGLGNGILDATDITGAGINSSTLTVSNNKLSVIHIGIFIRGPYMNISHNEIFCDSIGILLYCTAIETLSTINDNIIQITAGITANPYSTFAGTTGTYGILVSDTLDNFSIIGNVIKLKENAGAILNDSACIRLGKAATTCCNNFTIQSNKTTIFATVPHTTVAHIYVLNPGSGGFSILNNHIDNRTNADSCVNGLYVVDINAGKGAGVMGVGTVSGNFIDGTNNSGGATPPWELYVDSDPGLIGGGAMIAVKGNVVSEVTQGALMPARSVDAGGAGLAFTDGVTNTEINEGTSLPF